MTCAVAFLLAAALAGQAPAPGTCAQVLPRLEAAHRQDPKNVAVLAHLLHCELELQQRARANRTYQELEGLLPGKDPRLLGLGALLANQGAYPLAIRAFQKVLRADPTSYDAAYNLGLAFHLSGDTQNAESVLTKLLAERETAEAQNLLGQVFQKSGDKQQALRHYFRAMDMELSNEDYMFDYCMLVLDMDSKSYGTEQLAVAVADFPQSPRLWVAYGAASYLAGKNDLSFAALQRARQLAPDFPLAYYYLGRLYRVAAPPMQDQIVAILKERLTANPRDAWAHFFYGTSLADQQQDQETPDYTEALIHLRAAVRLDGKLAEAHLRLGLIASEQGKLAESVTEFEQAAAANPSIAEAHYRLGLAYTKLGKQEMATREFEAFQKLRGAAKDQHGKRKEQVLPVTPVAGSPQGKHAE
jgi:tetratricopeptide (TPR) repeat protein